MIALGESRGENTMIVAVLFALACNSAFMLPVATPPNAIVFGTNLIKKQSLMSHGFLINILSWILFTTILVFAL